MIRKITDGYVVQTWDEEKKRFTDQEFIAEEGDSTCFDGDGDSDQPEEMEDTELQMLMVQPGDLPADEYRLVIAMMWTVIDFALEEGKLKGDHKKRAHAAIAHGFELSGREFMECGEPRLDILKVPPEAWEKGWEE